MKTQCKYGHALTPQNRTKRTSTRPQGRCRECLESQYVRIRKTTCKRGHPRTPENTTKWRTCKACDVERQLQKLYGISYDQYQKMIQDQNNECAICGTKGTAEKRLCVDHNHSLDKVRKLLCTNCNAGLGSFKEDIERLTKAIAYLKENN